MKIILFIIALTTFIHAESYIGCGATKQDALFELSANIRLSIKNNFEQKITVNSNDDNIQNKISSYLHTYSNLSLVNIHYKNKNNHEICAFVQKSDQKKNTREMLKSALLYDEKNLPKTLNLKIKKLTQWLDNIKQLNFLMPVFLENSQKSQNILNKKEKIFSDLYAQSIAKSDSLVYKRCAVNDTQAKQALNKFLFKNQAKEEKHSFLSAITSIFESEEPLMIDLFREQVSYVVQDQKKCALIKKVSLLNIANKMYGNVERFSINEFSKDPKKRYNQINNYFELLNVTKALIKLYPKNFNDYHFKRIIAAKKTLTEMQKSTYPQFVLFNMKGAEKISIKLDDKTVVNNKKNYIQNGEHTYTLTANEKCTLTGTLSTELFEDRTIVEDFTKRNYPTVIFVTNQDPKIVLNGKLRKANTVTPIRKCDGKMYYVAKFAGQTKNGTIALEADGSYTIELNFLTSQELSLFRDTKTKSFTMTAATKFSDSLTPISSEKLTFHINAKPQHGELQLHKQGTFQYKPNKEFVGIDSFEYIIKTEDKISAPKIVNITVKPSHSSQATIPQEPKNDLNVTKENIQKKIEKNVKDIKEEHNKMSEDRYEKFKIYVESQQQNIEKLKKLQKTYPYMFERLLKEKIAP